MRVENEQSDATAGISNYEAHFSVYNPLLIRSFPISCNIQWIVAVHVHTHTLCLVYQQLMLLKPMWPLSVSFQGWMFQFNLADQYYQMKTKVVNFLIISNLLSVHLRTCSPHLHYSWLLSGLDKQPFFLEAWWLWNCFNWFLCSKILLLHWRFCDVGFFSPHLTKPWKVFCVCARW